MTNHPGSGASRPVALVTGAGRGIGAAIADRLHRTHRVMVNDLDPDRAAEQAAQLGEDALAVPADVCDSAAVDAMFDTIEQSVGPVDCVVNNAGISGNAAIRDVTDDWFTRIQAVDLGSVLHCSRRALASMRERRTGTIVNVASRAWLGWWGQSAYASAKAGVVGMTRALAVEMGSRGIRINAVAPGMVDTPMLRDRSPEALDRLLRSVPMGTLGSPDHIAAAVEFLAGDAARSITGQVLYICGGKSVYAYPDWPDRPTGAA